MTPEMMTETATVNRNIVQYIAWYKMYPQLYVCSDLKLQTTYMHVYISTDALQTNFKIKGNLLNAGTPLTAISTDTLATPTQLVALSPHVSIPAT